MNEAQALRMRNGESVERAAVPVLANDEFRRLVMDAAAAGARISALFGMPQGEGLRLVAVLADDPRGALSVLSTDVGDSYPALTPDCPQAHWFEREIAETWGVKPEGHPWLKPIRFVSPRRAGRDAFGRSPEAPILPCVTEYFQVSGPEIHEVAVGPVHAGIIEPGHFRFQCHGEHVFSLEISLGYQHRGVERALTGGPNKRSIHYAETLAGDTSIGHGLAFCGVVEALCAAQVPPRALALRGIALELERLANHTGDLGALAGDVGYLPTASYCGRLRGDFLNMTALVCGSRFGRGWVRPGASAFDLDDARRSELGSRLGATLRDVENAADLLWNTPSVLARFEDTGRVPPETCRALGLVGPAARASGLRRDVRFDHPAGIYCFSQLPVAVWRTGDVFARAYVRWLEIRQSAEFIRQQLASLPAGPLSTQVPAPAPDRLAVSLVEGWRGEICHVALTDAQGRFECYKVVDPSFHNWAGLAMALRDQQISDFPLCNKSFNLSYCGHDL